MPRKKIVKDMTASMISRGLATMTRRITVPIIHKVQIEYTADVFADLAEKLRLITRKNSLRNYQKVSAAQREVMMAHFALKRGWVDPRTRGASMSEYTENGLQEWNGIDTLDNDLTSGEAEKRLMDARAKFLANKQQKGTFTND